MSRVSTCAEPPGLGRSERRTPVIEFPPRLRLVACLAENLNVAVDVLTAECQRNNVVDVHTRGQERTATRTAHSLTELAKRRPQTSRRIAAARYHLTALAM